MAAELVLLLCVESPAYVAVIAPDPAVVPVNVTEQLVTPSVIVKVHDVALSMPPVAPGVSAKVTAPVGEFTAAEATVTIAVAEAVQLDPPDGMVQLTSPTLVEV